jgi:chaperonin GroEL
MTGVDTLADAVSVTLGPKGRNVILEREFGTDYVTKDGVTVAKEVHMKDPISEMGCRIVKNVAMKTNDEAGDGTTTSVVLTRAILKSGVKLLSAGVDPIELKKGIKYASSVVLDYIKDCHSHSVDGNFDTIKQIATVSANGDKEIGELIAEAMQKVTTEGVIVVDTAKGVDTSIEVTDGMEIERGYCSPYFITDQDKGECVYENPWILIVDKNLSSTKELVPILEKVNQCGVPLVIIAKSIDGELLQTLAWRYSF